MIVCFGPRPSRVFAIAIKAICHMEAFERSFPAFNWLFEFAFPASLKTSQPPLCCQYACDNDDIGCRVGAAIVKVRGDHRVRTFQLEEDPLRIGVRPSPRSTLTFSA
jgi:hypothetical protein